VGIWGVMGKIGAYRMIWGNLSEESHFEELDIEKRKLYKIIFKK